MGCACSVNRSVYARSAKYLDTHYHRPVTSPPPCINHTSTTIVVAPSRVVSVPAEVFDPEIFSETAFMVHIHRHVHIPMCVCIYTTRACAFAVDSRNVDAFYTNYGFRFFFSLLRNRDNNYIISFRSSLIYKIHFNNAISALTVYIQP